MRLLFVKHSLAWPRSSGHDVHCFNMMKALAELGEDVSLATVIEPHPSAVEGLALASRAVLKADRTRPTGQSNVRLTALQERFRSYFGIDPNEIASLRALAATSGSDAVVAVGFETLPFLAGVDGALRIWYAADEWVYHHLSCVRLADATSWIHVKHAVLKGAYERAYAGVTDRIWVVSESERRAARWFAGMKVADVLPNGVDADYFRPANDPQAEQTAVFWGRLDFQPNVEALTWFCRKVWPRVLREVPDARFTIVGFRPSAAVRRLAGTPGISLQPDVPDIRAIARRHAIVVLPFVSGSGIKNKLLEAAALGKAVVCSPRASAGLRSAGELPLVMARTAPEWVDRMLELWKDPARRQKLGCEARDWVVKHHSWISTAREAVTAIRDSAPAVNGAVRRAAR